MSTLKQLAGWPVTGIMALTGYSMVTSGVTELAAFSIFPGLGALLTGTWLIKSWKLAHKIKITKKARKEALDYIKNYTFSEYLLNNFKKEHKLFDSEISYVVEGLKQYLAICVYEYHCGTSKNKKMLMPSRIVDDLWHDFILSTHAYRDFCNKVMKGNFIHHIPSGNPELGDEELALLHTYRTLEKIAENGLDYKIGEIYSLFAVDDYLKVKEGFFYKPEDIRTVKARIIDKEKEFRSTDSSGTDGYFSAWIWSSDYSDTSSSSYSSYVASTSVGAFAADSYHTHSISLDSAADSGGHAHSCGSSCSSSSCSSSSCGSSCGGGGCGS